MVQNTAVVQHSYRRCIFTNIREILTYLWLSICVAKKIEEMMVDLCLPNGKYLSRVSKLRKYPNAQGLVT